MAIFSSWKGGLLLGLIVGAGAGFALPVIAPSVGKAARPKVKAAVRAGLLAFERGRVALEDLREQADDLVAETMAEMESLREAAPQAQSSPAPSTRGAGLEPAATPDGDVGPVASPVAAPREAA